MEKHLAIRLLLTMWGIACLGFSGTARSSPGPQDRVEGQASGVPSGGAVFELRYQPLTAPDDVLSYRSYWGFGSSPAPDVPFVEAVKGQVPEFDLVFNRNLQHAQWSVVELKNKKPVALYFDLDGNGKLSDSERILPTASSKPQPDHEFAFITPDFMIRQEDGRQIPFRVMLVGSSYGSDRMNYMWSPCCILEGQATLAGEPMRLLLYGNGFTGSFTTFGRCSFALVPAQQKLEGHLPRATLSSLVCHKDGFYRLKFDGAHEKNRMLRATFEKDTTPTGRMTANVKGTETLKARLVYGSITGDGDASIYFHLANVQSAIPAGRYRLSSGYVAYGAQNDDQWRVNFDDGPRFTIDADKTAEVEVGALALSVTALDERERNSSNAKEKSTYARGTSIYLAPQIKGKAGEVYLRFSQDAGGNRWTDVKPHVAILDAEGKQVASADMEYG